MRGLWPYVLVGLASGSIYALAALGLVLTFKTSGIFNFAHGGLAALGAYLMYEFSGHLGLPWPVALVLVVVLVGGGAGLLLERLAYGLTNALPSGRVVATVGLMVGIQGVLVVAYGSQPRRVPYFLPTRLISVGGVNVRIEQLIVMALVALTGLGLSWFLVRTRSGVAMQAVVDNPGLLSLQAVDPLRIRRLAWMIGSSLAALSGALLAPTTGLDPGILTLLVFYAFGAAAVGGFTSLPLTYAGGLAIGLGASLLTRFLNTTSALAALPSTLPFIVLFFTLLIRPTAVLVERRGGSGSAKPTALRLNRRTSATAALVVIGVLLALPEFVGPKLSLYSSGLGFVILFASLGLLVQASGQISLCQMTFAAVGASTFAHAAQAGVPWPAAVLLGALVTVPVGALVAIPAIRLSGIYLAIATFGFGLLVQNLVFPSFLMFSRSGVVLRAPRPSLGALSLGTDQGYYYVLLAVATAAVLAVLAIRRSRCGRLLRGLADQPDAVDAHGMNTNTLRVVVFCASAGLAGLAGAVTAPVTGSATGVPYHYTISLTLVAVLYLAGAHPVIGAGVASLLYVVIPGYLNNATAQEWLPVAFGVGAILVTVTSGANVAGRWSGSARLARRAAHPRLRLRESVSQGATT